MRDPTTNLAHRRRYEGAGSPSAGAAGGAGGTGGTGGGGGGSEMMLIGTPCALASCHREDFLPLCCARCHEPFCAEHAEAARHGCRGTRGRSGTTSSSGAADGDEGEHGFHVPVCPICLNAFPGWHRASDASPRARTEAQSRTDAALAAHLAQCPAMVQLARARPGQHIDLGQFRSAHAKTAPAGRGTCCARACHKTLITPIICPACHNAFCPSHRMPDQHMCAAPVPAAAPPGKTRAASRIAAGAASGSRLAASVLAKGESSTSARETKPSSPHSWSFGDWKRKLSSIPVGKSESEKRAEDERASQIRAMAARHARGLLSAKEQVMYAELCAQNPELAKRLKAK